MKNGNKAVYSVSNEERSEFSYKGLDYIFVKEPGDTDWTLTYVGDEGGRRSPSNHAVSEAWQLAGLS